MSASSQSSHPEQKGLTSKDTKNPNRDYGAIREIENLPTEELFKKLEMLECLLENQRKFLQEHDAKIQEIETVINKLATEKTEKGKN